MLLAKFMTDPVWWFYIFWLPKYLIEARHLSVENLRLFGFIPFLAAVPGSIAGGWLSGYLLRRGRSVNFARKTALLACASVCRSASWRCFPQALGWPWSSSRSALPPTRAGPPTSLPSPPIRFRRRTWVQWWESEEPPAPSEERSWRGWRAISCNITRISRCLSSPASCIHWPWGLSNYWRRKSRKFPNRLPHGSAHHFIVLYLAPVAYCSIAPFVLLGVRGRGGPALS